MSSAIQMQSIAVKGKGDSSESNNSAAASEAAVVAAPSTSGYLQFLQRLHQSWRDSPDITITYDKLSYTLKLPLNDHKITNVFSAAFDLVKKLNPFHHTKTHLVPALAPTQGIIKPGSMTLILAPPGHGKTSFLKALSGRLSHDNRLTGSIKYNGLSREEAEQKGIYVSRLCAYVGQTDLHFPSLTVHETMDFVAKNAIAPLSLLGNADLTAEESKRADLMIDLLGLTECRNTIIGNDLLRGVSGGQRKRVSIGEMLMTNARAYFLDEVSTGLDAAVTLHIFNMLKQICRLSHTSIVTSLLQPTPETYELFDDIILMKDGYVVFHGPRDQVKKWLWDVAGLDVPKGVEEAGFLVDFLTDPEMAYNQAEQALYQSTMSEHSKNGRLRAASSFLPPNDQSEPEVVAPPAAPTATTTPTPVADSQPAHHIKNKFSISRSGNDDIVTFHYDQNELSTSKKDDAAINHLDASPIATSVAPQAGTYNGINKVRGLRGAPKHSHAGHAPVHSTEELHQSYLKSSWYETMNMERQAYDAKPLVLDPSTWSEYTKTQYCNPYPHSALTHTKLCIQRQAKILSRNRTMVKPRLIQSVIMSLIYGTLFYQLSPDDFSSILGLLLYSIMYGAFGNLTELPVAAEAKNVVAKQIDAGFFPSGSYTLSVMLVHIPLTVIETIVFGTILYWLTGLVSDAGRYFFFLLLILIANNALSTFFRSISYLASNPDVARQLDLPFIVIGLLMSGFLIAYDKIPNWLIWLFWISPFSWAVRSLALNQFQHERYNNLIGGVRAGDYYMKQFGLQTDPIYQWMGVIFLFGFYLTFGAVTSRLASKLQPITPLGTKRLHKVHTADPEVDEEVSDDEEVPQPQADGQSPQTAVMPAQPAETRIRMKNRESFKLSALPFVPVTLGWRNINYTVYIGEKKVPRQLLTDISGYSAPGQMTALMGSSGAGKTTLMDVIAGRKTMGTIEGEVLVNGYPIDIKGETFQRLTGYVEQNDIHIGTATVREALRFSAKLRLPTTVTQEQREQFVEEIMELVGLAQVADRLIGDIAIQGLSPGQLKLVTIAVELCANPSVIFLDEPTSGLDAVSAQRVMKAVRRIAGTGRTVLCTIHQPSAELFFMFDRLLLLKTGGRDVYFHDVGKYGNQVVQYFEKASNYTEQIPPGINPANWMLDVIGAAGQEARGSDKPQADYAAIWRSSEVFAANAIKTERACTPAPNSKPITIEGPFASDFTRFTEVLFRLFTSHWRNPPMNLTRALLMAIIGILFGLVYQSIGIDDFGGVQSFLSVLFLGMAFPASVAAGSALPTFYRQRAVYYREKTVKMYDFWTYITSITIVELPYIFFALMCFIIPFYFLVGLANDAELFFRFVLSAYLMSLTYSFLSQLWLALLPNIILANVINGFFMSIFFMFGGLFIKPSKIPIGWKWFFYLDPVPKAFSGVALQQLRCPTGKGCGFINLGNNQTEQVYYYVADLLESSADNYGPMMAYLIATMFFFRILTLISLKKVSHIRR